LFSKLIDQDRAMFGFRTGKPCTFLYLRVKRGLSTGLSMKTRRMRVLGTLGFKQTSTGKASWVLLAHEQSHSWDGKYRRPAEMHSKPDYRGPERTSMLWVYEGLNQYIGMLLATRAGFNDAEYMRDYLGRTAAEFANEPENINELGARNMNEKMVSQPITLHRNLL
jgi:predicted metalloprotease with PDZ domain